jgi:hypothetical protein
MTINPAGSSSRTSSSNGGNGRSLHPTPELSEAEKESDREQVARYWPLVVDFFAGWIERYEPGDPRGVAMALELRKAMR